MLDEYESTLLVLAVVLGNNTVPIDEDTLVVEIIMPINFP